MPLLYITVQPPLSSYRIGFSLTDNPQLDYPERSALGGTIWNSVFWNSFAMSRRRSLGLAGAPTNISGFYLARAVYSPNLPMETLRQPDESAEDQYDRSLKDRVPHAWGCVIGAIDIDRLLEEALKGTTLEIALEIYDDSNPSEGQRLNEHVAIPAPEDRGRRPDLTNRVLIWKKNRQSWAMVFYPTAEFEEHSPRRIAWIALGAGLAATLCITGLVWVQAERRFAAETHARQMNEARDVIESLSREREQSSRDLHDGVLQSLYAVSLGMQRTQRSIARDPAEAAEMCRQNLDALELAMGELRRHLGRGRTEKTEELDLGFALGRLAEIMNREGRVPVQFELEPGLNCRPAPDIALRLLQIAREAITNAERHSEAELIRVGLSRRDGGLEMTIADNGWGFDPEQLPAQGYGLKNLADRAAQIGAEYRLRTRAGEGVRLTVHLPWTRCAKETANA